MTGLLFFFLQFNFPTHPIFSIGLYYQTQRQSLCPYNTTLLTALLGHWFAHPFPIVITRACFAGHLYYQQSFFDLLRPQEQVFRLMSIWNAQQVIEGILSHQSLGTVMNNLFYSNFVLLIGLFCLSLLKSQRPVMIEKMV